MEDEDRETDAVLHGARPVVGKPTLGPGPALRAFPDLGVDAALDDLEPEVVEDTALPVDGVDAVEVGAAGSTGLDGDRLLDDGLAPGAARLRVQLRALAVAPGPPRALVLVRLRQRQTGVPARLAWDVLPEHGPHPLHPHPQAADERLALREDLAVRAEVVERLPEGVDLLVQGRAIPARPPDASTVLTVARTASRSPSGIAQERRASLSARRGTRGRSREFLPAYVCPCGRPGTKRNPSFSVTTQAGLWTWISAERPPARCGS